MGLIIGLIGVYLVFRPSYDSVEIGLLVALLSGLFSACLFVATRHIAHEPFLRILFYYFLIIALCLSPTLFFHWTTPPSLVWLLFLGSGVCLVAAQIGLVMGLRRASSQDAAPFIYTSVIFSGLIDWIVWGNVPDLIALLGMGVVCLGGLIAMKRTSA